MSEAKARATTRQLRRAMGAEAIGVVNNHAAELAAIGTRLDALTKQVAAHQREIENMPIWSKVVDATLDRHNGILYAIDQRVTKFIDRTFWQRLRRLVTGR